jgi:hypothetical protein
MSKYKQLHFIAAVLSTFALSPALVPVCHAQLGDTTSSDVAGDASSDEVNTEIETGGSGSGETDTGSGQEQAGSPASATDLESIGVMIFQAAGPNPDPPATEQSIQSTVDAFRAAFGGMNNGNSPGPLLSGRREINWDGGGNNTTTDSPATPFNVFLDTRGAQFQTPGQGLIQGPPDGLAFFFNNPTYNTIFSTFSPLRLFTPVGSNVTNALFFIPGTNGGTRALVRGFGAVFTDVDQQTGSGFGGMQSRRSSTIEYFDASNKLLFRGIVPASPRNANISFFGIVFDEAIIARVRIITGNSALGPDDGDGEPDIVVMDDFIYGEPQMIP